MRLAAAVARRLTASKQSCHCRIRPVAPVSRLTVPQTPSHRPASSAASINNQLSDSIPEPLHTEAATIWQYIRLLEDDIGGDPYWSDRLREGLLDLEPRKTRISIYGDTLAAPEDFVSSLLRTPFSDGVEISEFISARATARIHSDILKFDYRSTLTREANELGLPSGWLQQSGVELYEIIGPQAAPHLLRSDVAAIVVDPFRLLDVEHIRILPIPLLEKSVIVVNGDLPSHQTADAISARLRKVLGASFSGSIIFCNARLAIQAYDVLQSGGQSPSPDVVSGFQELFLASGIGHAQRQLAQVVDSSRRPVDTVIGLAAEHARERIQADTDLAQHMLRTVRDLRTSSEIAATRARNLSVASRQIDGGRIQGSVESSKSDTALRVETLFQQRLSWLSLLFRLRVDDVAGELEREISKAFVDVEQQLVYEAGQLYQLQRHLSEKADEVIRRTDSPFNSAVLTNRLSTLSLSIPAVEAPTLVEPIQRRRVQLAKEILPILQTDARWLSYQTYGGAAGGVAASWAAYVPPLELISSSTATGLAALSVVASIWAGQSRWHRSQKAFWRAWERYNDMLAVDIKAAFSSAVDSFVVAKPNAAAEGLEQLAQKRLAVLSRLERRLDSMASPAS